MSRDVCLIPRRAVVFRFGSGLFHIRSFQARSGGNDSLVLAWVPRLHLGKITNYSLRSVRGIPMDTRCGARLDRIARLDIALSSRIRKGGLSGHRKMCRLGRGCGRWGLWRGTRVLFGCFAGCRFCGLCRGGWEELARGSFS